MISEKKQIQFMLVARQISFNSKCLSRQLGAVLVTPDCTIIGTGYNGPARGVPHCNSLERMWWTLEQIDDVQQSDMVHSNWGRACPRKLLGFKSGEGLEFCQAGHAERNCIVNSARQGIRTKDCWLFTYSPMPCTPCAIEIVNAGISTVVCLDENYDNGAKFVLKHGKVKVIEWSKTQLEENQICEQ